MNELDAFRKYKSDKGHAAPYAGDGQFEYSTDQDEYEAWLARAEIAAHQQQEKASAPVSAPENLPKARDAFWPQPVAEQSELPPLPPYLKYALHCLAGAEAKAEAERQMRDYARAAIAASQQAAEPVECPTCNGTGVVDDGEIDHYPNGEPYMCGPVKCVKDCPDCAAPAIQQPQDERAATHDAFSVLEDVFANGEAHYKVKISIDACNNVVIRYDDMDEVWSDELRAALAKKGGAANCQDNEGEKR